MEPDRDRAKQLGKSNESHELTVEAIFDEHGELRFEYRLLPAKNLNRTGEDEKYRQQTYDDSVDAHG
ncbi:MAG: hypothetical protein Pars2KO_10640 [Parasphingorhabdus sp.]